MTRSRNAEHRRETEVLAVAAFMEARAVEHRNVEPKTMTTWWLAFTEAGLIRHRITVSRFSRILDGLGYPRGRSVHGTVILHHRLAVGRRQDTPA